MSGYILLLCVLIYNYSILTFKKPKRMKKFFAILAIVALASCGGSETAPAADTTAVEAPMVDTAAPVVDTTVVAADTTAAAAPVEAK